MWTLILSVLINDVSMGYGGRYQTIALNHTAVVASADACRKTAELFHGQVKVNYPKNKVTLSYACAPVGQ